MSILDSVAGFYIKNDDVFSINDNYAGESVSLFEFIFRHGLKGETSRDYIEKFAQNPFGGKQLDLPVMSDEQQLEAAKKLEDIDYDLMFFIANTPKDGYSCHLSKNDIAKIYLPYLYKQDHIGLTEYLDCKNNHDHIISLVNVFANSFKALNVSGYIYFESGFCIINPEIFNEYALSVFVDESCKNFGANVLYNAFSEEKYRGFNPKKEEVKFLIDALKEGLKKYSNSFFMQFIYDTEETSKEDNISTALVRTKKLTRKATKLYRIAESYTGLLKAD
jgi:hypothetical protein